MNYMAIPGLKWHEAMAQTITPEFIISVVCRKCGLKVESLMSKRRYQPIVESRFICMFLIKDMTRLSLKAIGDIFSKDHTTVIHACRVIEDHMYTEPELRRFVARLKDTIITERP